MVGQVGGVVEGQVHLADDLLLELRLTAEGVAGPLLGEENRL